MDIKFLSTNKKDFIIFGSFFGHNDISFNFIKEECKPFSSAGFVSPKYNKDKSTWNYKTFGNSHSLKIESNPTEDDPILENINSFYLIKFNDYKNTFVLSTSKDIFNVEPVDIDVVKLIVDKKNHIFLVDEHGFPVPENSSLLYSSIFDVPDFEN